MDDDEFVVERILGFRVKNGVRQYKVKWAGFSGKYNRWVNENDIVQGASQLILDYERRVGALE